MKSELANFIITSCSNNPTFFLFTHHQESQPRLIEDFLDGDTRKKTTAIACENIMPIMAAIAWECEQVFPDQLGESTENVDVEDIRLLRTAARTDGSFVIY